MFLNESNEHRRRRRFGCWVIASATLSVPCTAQMSMSSDVQPVVLFLQKMLRPRRGQFKCGDTAKALLETAPI
jgi:hypothetical protein